MSEQRRIELELALINYRALVKLGKWADADRVYYKALNKPLPEQLRESVDDRG